MKTTTQQQPSARKLLLFVCITTFVALICPQKVHAQITSEPVFFWSLGYEFPAQVRKPRYVASNHKNESQNIWDAASFVISMLKGKNKLNRDQIDSLTSKFYALVKEQGYPTIDKVGEQTEKYAFLLLYLAKEEYSVDELYKLAADRKIHPMHATFYANRGNRSFEYPISNLCVEHGSPFEKCLKQIQYIKKVHTGFFGLHTNSVIVASK